MILCKFPLQTLVTHYICFFSSAHHPFSRYGPSLFDCIGTLVGWNDIPRLHKITADTLVYNGEFDTSHDIAQEPYFELIPRVRWITFPNGSHFCHLDEGGLRERVLKVVGRFLTNHGTEDKVNA
jgi:pimeloyl-ACP methyl ester carboxylesterase